MIPVLFHRYKAQCEQTKAQVEHQKKTTKQPTKSKESVCWTDFLQISPSLSLVHLSAQHQHNQQILYSNSQAWIGYSRLHQIPLNRLPASVSRPTTRRRVTTWLPRPLPALSLPPGPLFTKQSAPWPAMKLSKGRNPMPTGTSPARLFSYMPWLGFLFSYSSCLFQRDASDELFEAERFRTETGHRGVKTSGP